MATWTQDYPPLPGSVDAAVLHARTIAEQHQPSRVDDAAEIVRALFRDALTRTGPDGNINLITTVDIGLIRFEVHDPNTPTGAVLDPDVHRLASARADWYGSTGTRAGHMVWAELGARRAVAS
ncbi:hypothetical protein HS041_12475 [Planomonospora sp. ID67723]|uniref:hypothetical protein n=1 Tax=Planomonospora sp. ID67723 TaxID=2738134 RepID=UPI0018C406A1|nr:hypothetical protein [Planomonospora sp. ID67723]MBG0828585.1 hypothetical protein [Planomonospora sp. ID67723]